VDLVDLVDLADLVDLVDDGRQPRTAFHSCLFAACRAVGLAKAGAFAVLSF
jgi:hypothetical protein